MNMFDIILSTGNIVICILGFLMCLVLLMDKNLNDKTKPNIVALCLVGFGWTTFLYSSIDLFEGPNVFDTIGRICFLLGILIWFFKNTFQFQINKIKGD